MNGRREETEKLEAGYRDALGKPPPRVTDGALASILAATTRRPRASSPLAGRRLALAGAAAAGVAALAVLKGEGGQEIDEEALELAGLDLELLDELELCRDLEAVELLELLEEMEDG